MLVEPEDPRALADALLRLREMPAARRREMGLAARQRAAEFTIERQAEGIESAYREALER